MTGASYRPAASRTPGWLPRTSERVAEEIARERYALKALRGDFDDARGNAEAALRAARLRGPKPG